MNEYERVKALPEWLRKELTYLAFMKPDIKTKDEFYHNIAVSGERILKHQNVSNTEEPTSSK
jgi:hypothetical protein